MQVHSYEPESLARSIEQVTRELLELRGTGTAWTGHLSSSALATATAVSAFSICRTASLWPGLSRARMGELIDKGLAWCFRNQNPDGGWGDTVGNHSNVATTFLVMAATRLSGTESPASRHASENADRFFLSRAGTRISHCDPDKVVRALEARYGQDRTFAVPILANGAMAGLIPWTRVPALPCEAALVPPSWFRLFRLPVVSYAIPALVAIGQARFLAAPPWNPVTRLLRRLSLPRGLQLLESMQPSSGGYLEAVPLTAFVAMSLAHSGRSWHGVTQKALLFLESLFRDEGNCGTWPIDSNLATWITTLAINALHSGHHSDEKNPQVPEPGEALLDWVLQCQFRTVHPFAGSPPGGWGWTDLPGSVPDADDTPGALLALRVWWRNPQLPESRRARIAAAARDGIEWLLNLQNRDGGWPTFCKGWGRMPFDRSGADITAHVLRALIAWQADLGSSFASGRLERAVQTGIRFLERVQRPDGSWVPLWFGNQDDEQEENPVYGTSRVLLALADAKRSSGIAVRRGAEWLVQAQHAGGSWGGGPSRHQFLPNPAVDASEFGSVQETALAIQALASLRTAALRGRRAELSATGPEAPHGDSPVNSGVDHALERGKTWLIGALQRGEQYEKWPIGFYFSRLWYHERAYPLIFSLAALKSLERTSRAGEASPQLGQ